MDTNELIERTAALVFGEPGPQRQAYRDQTRELEAQWRAWLADEYASALPEAAQQAIWDYAWDQGHASGYNEVEMHYSDVAAIANLARG